jgi:nucleotide-binding universal stress UspA family protein
VPENDPRSWHVRAEGELSSWVEPLRGLGVPVETLIVEDIHPLAALAHTAVDRSADLIVVGAHHLGAFTKARSGGIAVQLIHRVGVPVVLVPDTANGAPSAFTTAQTELRGTA